MKNFQKGSAKVWLIIIILLVIVGYFALIKNSAPVNSVPAVTTSTTQTSTQITSQTTSTQSAYQAKSKIFIEAMLKELGKDYSVSASSRTIAFPGSGSGPSIQKNISGYIFTYSDNATTYDSYLKTTVGPTPGWLVSETSAGYVNTSIICIREDASYPASSPRYNPQVPQHGSRVFCGDLM